MDKKEFIESLRNELKRGGIIRAITAQLKEEICSSYLRTCSPLPHFNSKCKIQSLEHIALRSLIFDFLICDDLQLTLSVYSTETGLDDHHDDSSHQHHHHTNSCFMSAHDICKAFEIKTESKFFKIMTSTKENDKSSKGAEQSMISKILSGIPSLINDVPTSACASTQTHEDDKSSSILLARKDLEDHLQQIKDKYVQQSELLSQSYRSSSEVLESQMFAFQRECEERERARMERELEVYKKTTVEAIKRECSEMYSRKMDESKRMLKAEYDRNLDQLNKKEEKVREEFIGREKEREKEHLADLHRLMREIEHFKKREHDNKSMLDVERRKLELEEQRVKNILLTAEMKLSFAETKEREIRESMTNEYNRVRLAAKQTYDDASDSVKKQMEFYAVELDRLNALRRENENRLIAHEALEIEASRLRVENAELKTNLDDALAQLTSLKLSKEDAEQKASHKINLLQSEMSNLRNEVGTFQGSLLIQSKNEVARVSERYERIKNGLEQKCNRLSLDLWNAKQEKQVSHDQICELQKLLCRSEGALRNVHMYHEEERSGGMIEGSSHHKKQEHFREVVDTNIQERTNCSSSKFLVNGTSTTTKEHLTIGTTASRKQILPCTRGINFYRVIGDDRSPSFTNTIDYPEDHFRDQVVEGYFIQEHEKQCVDASNSTGGGGILQEMKSNPLLLQGAYTRTTPPCTTSETTQDKYDTIHITTSSHQLVDEDSNEVLNKEDDRKQPPLLGMIINKPPYDEQQEERQSVEGKIEQVDRRHSQKSKRLYNGENSTQATNLKSSNSLDGTSTASRREDPNCDSSKKYQLPEMHSVTTSSEEFLPISCAEESTQDPSIRQTNDEGTYTLLEVEGRDDENYASDFEIESVSIA